MEGERGEGVREKETGSSATTQYSLRNRALTSKGGGPTNSARAERRERSQKTSQKIDHQTLPHTTAEKSPKERKPGAAPIPAETRVLPFSTLAMKEG